MRFTGPAGIQPTLDISSPIAGGNIIGTMAIGIKNLDMKISKEVIVEVFVRFIDPGTMW